MTDNLARSFPLEQPAPLRAPHVEIVPTRQQRRARPRVVYALVTVTGIFAILLTQLLMSIAVADGAYQISALQVEQRDLAREEQAMQERLNTLSSTQNLAANAEALGMVSNTAVAYLSLADGTVIGSPAPASAAQGTLTGATGNLIPNALLADVPLVTAHAGTATTEGADSASVDEGASRPGTLLPAVASQQAQEAQSPAAGKAQGIPSPVTE